MSTMNSRSKKATSAAPQTVNRAAAAAELHPDAVRCRAYEIYLGRNGGPGDHLSDWNQAERELQASFDCLAGDGDGVNATAGGPDPCRDR